MSTKIFVSQIDSTNPDGSTATANSFIVLTSNGPLWVPVNEAVSTGPTGFQGSAGFHGSAGAAGAAGAAGPTGYTGSPGPAGPAGPAGEQGPIGEMGFPGFTGSVGPAGFQGSLGSQGPVGFTGSIGEEGEPGFQGSQGNVGYTGSPGVEGPAGYQGSAGYFGSTGYSGSLGDTGYLGSVGFTGSIGDQGPEGYRGSLGDVGYRGSAGESGSAGLLKFIELTDVPQTYAGGTGKLVRVNSNGDGLVFEANNYVQNPFSENVDAAGFILSNAILAGYGESVIFQQGSDSASIDPTVGNVYVINLNVPVSNINITNSGLNANKLYYVTLILQQDGNGTRTVDWSGQNIYWPSSENISSPDGPALSTSANYTDVVTLYTFNQGVYWIGVLSAKGFPTT